MKKMSKMDISEITPDDYLTWDKEKFIEDEISKKRTNNWYRDRYRRNLSISLTLAILSFISLTLSVGILKVKSGKVETYLTMTEGTVVKHSNTEEDARKIKKALTVIKGKK